jgi:4-hydroxy-tetrahydrodipicolinate synthase
MTEPFRGIFTIPATPLSKDLQVDWAALQRVVEFCVRCGAHGIVWPVNASQFYTLSDEERLRGMEVVVNQVAGRIPVVIGTQGLSTPHAQMFSRHANAVGADAVIAMAPYVQAMLDEDAIVDYYQGISDVVDVPVFIQNHTRGSVLSAKLMARIVQQAQHVDYIKEETFPVTHMVTQAIELCGPKLKGVFGGAGGRYMLLEYPRGVAGQMPGCHVTDVMVRFWNALDGGDVAEAKRIYGLLAPLYALETVKGASYPEVLRRRGVIDAVYSRSTTVSSMDAYDHRALDEILRDLEPLMTWHEGGPIRYSDAEVASSAPPPLMGASDSTIDAFDQA